MKRNKWDFFVSLLGNFVVIPWCCCYCSKVLDGTTVVVSWRNMDSFCGSSTYWCGSFSGYGYYYFYCRLIFVHSTSIPESSSPKDNERSPTYEARTRTRDTAISKK